MTNVYGTIQIVAAALHVKNGFMTALPTIHTENTDQLHLGLCFFYWQMDIADKCLWSRLAVTGTD